MPYTATDLAAQPATASCSRTPSGQPQHRVAAGGQPGHRDAPAHTGRAPRPAPRAGSCRRRASAAGAGRSARTRRGRRGPAGPAPGRRGRAAASPRPTAVAQPRRADQPAHPQRRRQRLAGRAHAHHPVGRQALDRAHRLPVVAELGVVVVLDDETVHSVRPLDQRVSSLGRQHHPGRRLVGRASPRRPAPACGRAPPRRDRARRRGPAPPAYRCGGRSPRGRPGRGPPPRAVVTPSASSARSTRLRP